MNPELDRQEPEEFKRAAESKLHILRDVEGEPNREELGIIRKLEKELSKLPAFIGLAPFGSVMGGYSKDPENKFHDSDIDVYLFFDGGKLETNYGLFAGNVEKIRDSLETTTKKAIHLNVIDVNPKLVIEKLRGELLGMLTENIFPVDEMATMSRVVTGKKIDEYRDTIAQEMRLLSVEQQKKPSH